ncbi:HDOD domain-containing protein [Symmachiella macrocystis]|nr:HDOD domain-containing protein [Symmachiella macrocystis]
MTPINTTELLRQVCGTQPPPIPEPGLQLCLELAADETTSPRFLADSLSEMPSLSRRFLILANSLLPTSAAARNAQTACATIEPALTADVLWVLALSDAMQHTATRSGLRLWKHSLLTAAMVRHIQQHLVKPPGGSAWVAGMAHDIGHLFLNGPATEQGIDWHVEHDRLLDQNPGPLPQRNHCLIGAGLLSLWNTPSAIISAAQYHHHPADADAEVRSLVALVRVADLIAEHVDAEHLREELNLEQSAAWQIVKDTCGMKSQSVEQLLADVLIPASLQADRLAGLLAK